MSIPTSPVPRVRADVLPNYTLSQPGEMAHLAIEEEIGRRFTARFVDIAVRIDPGSYEAAMAAASAELAKRPFKARSRAYYEIVLGDELLMPIMLWSVLRRFHRQITVAQAADLLEDNDYHVVREAVLDLWGYSRPKPPAGGEQQKPPAADRTDSITPPSPDASAPGGYPGTKSNS